MLNNSNYYSFVTLTYNHQKYIIEHLESIKYQILTYGSSLNIDLIVADDHSTDNTVFLINQWIKRNYSLFNSVIILENSFNQGTCANYVKAIKAVKSHYFKVLAGDDLYAYSNIFSLLSRVDDNSFVSGLPLILKDDSLELSKKMIFNLVSTSIIYKDNFKKAMRLFSSIHTPSLAYSKEFFDNNEVNKFIKKYSIVEDFAMQIIVSELNPKVRYVLLPCVFVYYRRTNNSAYIIKNDKFLTDKRRLYIFLAKKEKSFINRILLYNRIFCLKINNRFLKIILNLNSYIYFFHYIQNP
jgi:glycosyltransferase involved in cell wall biosynthesis